MFLNSEHYKWALDALFIKHNFDRVIILEGLISVQSVDCFALDISAYHLIFMVNWFTDDMEIAPDFFDYFEAAAKLLDNDKYVILYSEYTWQVND
jgi:alpha-1,3-mannosyl-glycoprotein beta-1,2-N-acetylglucosaminyltransferase